jgi:hypothetical protein
MHFNFGNWVPLLTSSVPLTILILRGSLWSFKYSLLSLSVGLLNENTNCNGIKVWKTVIVLKWNLNYR